MITAAEFAAAARSLVGTPTRHKGRMPGVALDCVGVVLCAAHACGLHCADFLDYGCPPASDSLLRELAAVADPTEPAPGAVVVLRWGGGVGAPLHVGVLSGVGQDGAWRFVHAGTWRVREIPLDDGWRDSLHSAWRLRGVA